MAKRNEYGFSEKQRNAAQERNRQRFREAVYEAVKTMKPTEPKLSTITSTNVKASTVGSISFGGVSIPSKTSWAFNWEPVTSGGTAFNPHEECTPTRDYNDIREVLIALLLRDHDGVIEFPQEMLDEIQNWKIVVDDNERSLRIVAIPPEVHVINDSQASDLLRKAEIS